MPRGVDPMPVEGIDRFKEEMRMRAMILAAGLGTRFRPLTYVMPKPVAPVLNRPIVAWIAELLGEHGFEDVVTNLSYLPEQIRGARRRLGLRR